MAYTVAELTEWVKGLGIPEDKQKSVLESMGVEGVLQKVGDSILAQKDYSRRMDELKANETRLKTDYDKKNAEVESFRGTLTKWKGEKEKTFTEAVAERDKALAVLTAARDKAKNLASTYGVPETEVNGMFAEVPVAHTEPVRDEKGKFVSEEMFNATMESAALIPAILASIDREHGKLFRDRPVDLVEIVRSAQKNKRSLRAEWEEQFKVEDRRKAVAEEASKNHDETIRKEAAEQERSRLLAEHPELGQKVRSDRMANQGSPVLDAARKATEAARKANEGKPPTEIDEGRGVRNAVAAWNQGKYNPGNAA